jgi:hypothetical protein
MSVAVLDRQASLGDLFEDRSAQHEAGASHSTKTDLHGGLTLDDLITGVWEGLAVRDSVCCPACGGAMVSRSAAPAGTHGGACRDCAAEIC